MMLAGDETLQSLLDALGERGTRVALAQIGHGTAEELTYADLAAQSSQLAAGLQARGLACGDRVVLLASNSPEWLVACVALIRAGLVPVPVDSQMATHDLAHIMSDSAARCVFTTTLGAQRLASIDPARRARVVLLDAPAEHGEFWRDLCAPTAPSAAPAASADTAVIFYTSGTSGPPKGVPLTHGNIVRNIRALLSLDLVRADDRVLLPLPLHHVYPFVIGLFTPLLVGMTIIVPSSLVGQHFLAALAQGQPSILLGVPRLYEALYATIEQRFASMGPSAAKAFRGALRLSLSMQRALHVNLGRGLFWIVRRGVGPRLRLLISGGSALDPDVAAKLEGLGFRLASGYGLTETSPILTFSAAAGRGLDHVGVPLPGVQLRIAEPEPHFEYGEVQAKGPNVFSGYLNLPEQTEAAFTADGWFRTGDLGYLDDAGFLHLSGRATSMIVMPGGENVDPEKIEQQLEHSASIREAGVLEHAGQLAGVIVPSAELIREKSDADVEQAIRAEITRLSRDLPSYQRLSDFVIDSSPLARTRLGKLRRRELGARYVELTEAGGPGKPPGLAPRAGLAPLDRELLEDRVAGTVWAWLGERFGGQPITPDTHMQLDLGVDSLEWLNLSLELRNRVGIDLTDEAVGRIETVRDLLQEAASAQQAGELAGGVIELLREPDKLLTERERAWLKPQPALSRVLDPIAALAAKVLMHAVFRVEASGLENLPRTAPYLIAPNHLSALDPIALAAVIGARRLRQTYWGGWVGILFRGRFRSALSHAMRVLPVEPRSGPLSNLALAAAVLRRGRNLVWFPEGQRSRNGELQRFRPGIGLLVLSGAVPVVPVWIEGTDRALPPGTRLPRPSRVTLRVGLPCHARELETEGTGDTAEERIANALQSRVRALGTAGTRPR